MGASASAMNKSLATPTRLHPAYAHGNAMPVTNLALLSQIHLSDESGCRSFAPNPFKPNICASCSRLINKHAPEAIPSDDALLRVRGHQGGRGTRSLGHPYIACY